MAQRGKEPGGSLPGLMWRCSVTRGVGSSLVGPSPYAPGLRGDHGSQHRAGTEGWLGLLGPSHLTLWDRAQPAQPCSRDASSPRPAVAQLGPSLLPAGSVESLSHTTSSPQPSPAASTHASRIANPSFSVEQAAADASATEETPSESESVFLPDYLFLSNCESGKLSHTR